MAFRIWRLFSGTSKFLFRKWWTRAKTITAEFVWVNYSLEEFVQHQKNKNTLSKTQRDVSSLKKFLVSRNEPRELELGGEK